MLRIFFIFLHHFAYQEYKRRKLVLRRKILLIKKDLDRSLRSFCKRSRKYFSSESQNVRKYIGKRY